MLGINLLILMVILNANDLNTLVKTHIKKEDWCTLSEESDHINTEKEAERGWWVKQQISFQKR